MVDIEQAPDRPAIDVYCQECSAGPGTVCRDVLRGVDLDWCHMARHRFAAKNFGTALYL